jgi:hypothetical protein
MDEILRTTSPAWQYTTKAQREDVLRGTQVRDWTAQRLEYVRLVSNNKPLFNTCVRIGLSALGYDIKFTNTFNSLNRNPNATFNSPIILCESTDAFGGALNIILRSGHKGGKIHAVRPEFVVPVDVDAVQRSSVNVPNDTKDNIKLLLNMASSP